jgi:hypothetical protein
MIINLSLIVIKEHLQGEIASMYAGHLHVISAIKVALKA